MTIGGDGRAAPGRPARRLLVVEDEYLVAMMVEGMLGELGYEVTQVAATLEAALAAASDAALDGAILDINLGGRPSAPVADVLTARGIPFIFATGYGSAGLDRRHADTPTLQKPFYEDELRRLLEAMFEGT